MTTQVQAPTQVGARSKTMTAVVLIAGWLLPGAGHFLLRKPIRGLLLFISIVAMFAIGIALQGKVYSPNTGDLLDILGFVGQLGAGLLYLVVAGLLNIIAAVDAHSLANGRKAS